MPLKSTNSRIKPEINAPRLRERKRERELKPRTPKEKRKPLLALEVAQQKSKNRPSEP